MPITKINVTAIGRSSALTEHGETDLSFVFPNLPDPAAAPALTHGFIDALTASAEGQETGLVDDLRASEVTIVRAAGGGAVASFSIRLSFTDGLAVERWLDGSGLIDGADLVTLIPGPVTWTFDEIAHTALIQDARAEAIATARCEAIGFADILESDSDTRLAELEQIGHHTRVTVEPAAADTLGDLLSARPTVEVQVTLRTVWTVLS